jgi:diguanylate cyclase (GGDEF)-like protein
MKPLVSHFSTSTTRLPSHHRGYSRYYAFALALWLLASAAALVLVLRASQEATGHEFAEYTENFHTHLRDKLRANETVLYGFAGFLGALSVGTNNNIHDSAKIYAHAVLERHPHIYMLEIVRKLPRQGLESYSAQLRRTILPSFQVRQFDYKNNRQWQATPRKDFYYPIVFIAPELPGSADIYGLDIDSLDSMRHALLRSEEKGIPVSSEPFRLVEGDMAYVMFRPAINRFARNPGRAEGVTENVSYAVLVLRTLDLLPPHESLSARIQHTAWHSDFSEDETALPLFDIAATPPSRLETFLLPKLRSERKIDDVSPPLRVVLERPMRLADLNTTALSLAGMASILSLAMLLAFLHSHDRHHLALVEERRAIEHLALHDALTGLPNRFLMLGHLEQAIRLASRHDMKVAVLFLDLDGFKPINDRYGHPVGDIVLKEIARRLQACVRDCDTAARYGSDEFVVLLTEIYGEENAALVAEKLLDSISQPIQTGSETVKVSASIGIAIFPNDGDTIEVLINLADKAMYVAKQNSPGLFAFSDPQTAS